MNNRIVKSSGDFAEATHASNPRRDKPPLYVVRDEKEQYGPFLQGHWRQYVAQKLMLRDIERKQISGCTKLQHQPR